MADDTRGTESGNRSPSGVPLIGAALFLVLAAGALVFFLWPRPRAHAAAEPTSLVTTQTVENGASPGVAETGSAAAVPLARSGAPTTEPFPPIDLFALPAPELISMGHTVVDRGGMLSTGKLKEIFEYGKAHPDDARPALIMAADSMNRQWEEFAIEHYVHAQKHDPRARQDPRMLRDLVSMAGDARYSAKADAALGTIYGPRALRAVEDALTEAGNKGDTAQVERLSTLSQTLRSSAAPP